MKFFLALFLFASASVYAESPKIKLAAADVTASNATLVCSQVAGELLCKPIESGEVELTTKNLITLRGPIMPASSSKFVADFHKLEHQDEVQRIYIYIKSPGGSIFAGDYIANIIKASKKEVVVLVDFAASMAFHVSQFGDKRLMLPTGTLMQHHASGGTGVGEFPNVDKQWEWIKRKVERMNRLDARACTRTSFNKFKENIDRDWWLLADEALKAGCIDAIAETVTCSKDLSAQIVKENISFFGMTIQVKWSGCPLEAYPRAIKVQNSLDRFKRLTPEQKLAVEQFIMLLTDPLQFYNTNGSFRIQTSRTIPVAE